MIKVFTDGCSIAKAGVGGLVWEPFRGSPFRGSPFRGGLFKI
jgi:hypothetical protein